MFGSASDLSPPSFFADSPPTDAQHSLPSTNSTVFPKFSLSLTHMSSSIFTKIADIAHRGVVLGLFSVFGFQIYQIAVNVRGGQVDSPYMQSTYFDDVKEKVEQEYKKDNIVDSSESRDWYEDGDDSYKKKLVRPNLTRPKDS